MAIHCKLSTLMGEHRYNIQNICDKTGISRSTVSTLYHDRIKRIDFETLDRLCTLFKCEPSDILRFEKTRELPADKSK